MGYRSSTINAHMLNGILASLDMGMRHNQMDEQNKRQKRQDAQSALLQQAQMERWDKADAIAADEAKRKQLLFEDTQEKQRKQKELVKSLFYDEGVPDKQDVKQTSYNLLPGIDHVARPSSTHPKKAVRLDGIQDIDVGDTIYTSDELYNMGVSEQNITAKQGNANVRALDYMLREGKRKLTADDIVAMRDQGYIDVDKNILTTGRNADKSGMAVQPDRMVSTTTTTTIPGREPQLDPSLFTRENMQKYAAGMAQIDPKNLTTAAALFKDPTSSVADVTAFNYFTNGMTPEQIEEARLIKLGLKPRAVTDPYASTVSRLIARQQYEPTIAADVKKAELGVTQGMDKQATAENNQKVWNTYQAAMGKVSEAMGGTKTGPVFGLVPAVTSGQLKAEGATAAMLPVLKQIFRQSGEGVFTDKDQEMLTNMMPTRKDTSESAAFKMQMIDSIVKAKLGITDEQNNVQQPLTNIRKAPQKALDALRANPEKINEFEAYYGYRPEGF